MVETDKSEPLGHTGAGPGSTIAVYRRIEGSASVVTAAFTCCDEPGAVERAAFGLT